MRINVILDPKKGAHFWLLGALPAAANNQRNYPWIKLGGIDQAFNSALTNAGWLDEDDLA